MGESLGAAGTAGVHSSNVTRVARHAIPTMRSVVVDGREHALGIHKDFWRSPAIAGFMPQSARLSMAWVRLRPGEVLATHTHPTRSMIVMADGEGLVHGDLESPMEAGDVVLVPPGCAHGFEGAGRDGFWALSVQFEGEGLYEDPSRARVRFEAGDEPGLRALLSRNEELSRAHARSKIFELLATGGLDDAARRARFLSYVSRWSEIFQRALLARSAVTEDVRYKAAFRRHLTEEFGHDTALAADAPGGCRFDARLEAACTWFLHAMLARDALEKVVLVHLVLEVGSAMFSRAASARLGSLWGTEYFDVHESADDAHAELGLTLLRGLPEATYAQLRAVQAEGWSMLDAVCDRLAELSASDG